ncbi:MAG TPA: CHAT domain-containing protein [Longimicrobiaceae bacterium]|nr:CHAT domain-containing protein [Longimicrobiaceae bacterium]
MLADLAAAHIELAQRTQSPRELLEAIEVSSQALELEPRSPPARFNLALAMGLLGLDERAAEGWRQFHMLDSTSAWAEEARHRARRPAAAPAARLPEPDASAAAVAAFAAAAPEEARLQGWTRLLGGWGEAFLAGDTVRAGERLRLAGALGAALEWRRGDATLADAVRAIHAVRGDEEAMHTLADAHRALARGRDEFLARRFESAERWFRRAVAGARGSAPLRQWATYFTGAALLGATRTAPAERVFHDALPGVDTVRQPALAGQLRWGLSTALLRSGDYEQGLVQARAAARLFARAGEPEQMARLQVVAADAEYALGNADAMHASMHRGLATLRARHPSVWLHNLLYIWSEAAEEDGYTRAAVQIQEEGVAAAARTRSPVHEAEARLARARRLTAKGDTARAVPDVELSRALLDGAPSGDWVRADLRLTEAGVWMRRDPRRANAALDSVVDYFEAIGNPARLVPALVARAKARLAIGRATAAEVDLARATELLQTLHSRIEAASLRASLLDAASQTVDQLVMLRVAAKDPVGALAYLERGRASFAPGTAGRPRKRPAPPPGHVAVEYALIGDTLLTWTVSNTAVHLTRATVDRERLTATLDDTRRMLERRTGDPGVRPALTELYDQLIRPVRERLGLGDTPLVIVADGEIAGFPLAALYDSARGRYLVQDHPIRFAASLRDADQGGRPRTSEAGTILLVRDPAFDRRAYPALEPLPGARLEAETIAAEYRNAKLLSGPEADRNGLEAALRDADILHYAGHAVFDEQRPIQSYLVLAPPRGGGLDGGRLSAAVIELLDLANLRLVVLSACRTSRAHGGRSGGFAGLAGALLAAGAGGVVGSLWLVQDELTRPLMVGFHRAYRESGDAAEALRTAQLRMLGSSDPGQQQAAAWAGFRYMGN